MNDTPRNQSLEELSRQTAETFAALATANGKGEPAPPYQRWNGARNLWIDRDPRTSYELSYAGIYRLAPPAEIPRHNPEGVTQEQLEPEKGWRFATVDEINVRCPLAEKCQCWMPQSKGWGSTSWAGNDRNFTYRTREPLPEKYQHLVPESEEARARRLLAKCVAGPEWGPYIFEAQRSVRPPEDDEYLIAFNEKANEWQHFVWKEENTDFCFYARARKLPTDKEKAEAALNAYKLEPGERLVHRGRGWNSNGVASYLKFWIDENGEQYITRNKAQVCGGTAFYYAEIIKEPEMVPFTQETFPRGFIWIREGEHREFLVTCIDEYGVYSGQSFWTYETLMSMEALFGTTWTRAGKGVGA